MAALKLAGIFLELEDTAGERAAYQVAIDSGDRDAAPVAWFQLGMLLFDKDQDDLAGARNAFEEALRQARDLGHISLAADAASRLWQVLLTQGDKGAAAIARKEAIKLNLDAGRVSVEEL